MTGIPSDWCAHDTRSNAVLPLAVNTDLTAVESIDCPAIWSVIDRAVSLVAGFVYFHASTLNECPCDILRWAAYPAVATSLVNLETS